jgi:excisionase family DNA binding protein
MRATFMPADPIERQEIPGYDSSREVIGEFLTVQEIAAILKVPVSWVYERTRRRGRDRIPHFKLGKYLRFHAQRVRAWLQALEEL